MLNGLGRHVGAAEGTITIGDHLDVDGAAICILWVPEEQRRSQVSQCALCWIRKTLHFSIPKPVSTHPLQGPATDVRLWCFGGSQKTWHEVTCVACFQPYV